MSHEIEILALLERGEAQEKKARSEKGDDASRKLHGRAADEYSKAAGLAEKHLGRFDENTLTIRDRLATTLRESGDISRAISVNKENINRYRDSQGDQNSLTLDAKRRLAECYLKNLDHKDAIKTYSNIVDSGGQISAIDLYQDRTDLAAALFLSGTTANIAEAVNINIKTLSMAAEKLGQGHIQVVKIRHNLASELAKLEKYYDAVGYFDNNVKLCKDPKRNASFEDDYRQYLERSEVSLKACSNILKRREKRKLEKETKEKEKQEKARLEKKRLKEEKQEKERTERVERERAERVERERAERVERERVDRIRKERAEKEEMRKQEKIQLQREAQRSDLEQERTAPAKPIASSSKERKTGERAPKPLTETDRPRSQNSRVETRDEKSRDSSSQKNPAKHKEEKKNGSQVAEGTGREVQDGKGKVARKQQGERRVQNIQLSPEECHSLANSRKSKSKTAPATAKSKSFESLPVLDQNTVKLVKETGHSRSRSTSGRPTSASSNIPEIMLPRQSRRYALVADEGGELVGHARVENADRPTKKHYSERNGPASDPDMKTRKQDSSAESAKEDVNEGRRTKTNHEDYLKRTPPRSREGSTKTRYSPSASAHGSGPGSVYRGRNQVLPECAVSKTGEGNATELDPGSAVVLWSNEDKSSNPKTSVSPLPQPSKKDSTLQLIVQRDPKVPKEAAPVKLDVPRTGSSTKSRSSSNPASLVPSWSQSLEDVSGYPAKAAGPLLSRRKSFSERSESSQTKKSGQTSDDHNMSNDRKQAVEVPLQSIRTVPNRTLNVPGSWDKDFDEPRFEQPPTIEHPKEAQDSTAMRTVEPQLPDIVPAPPVEATKARRRSRDLRQESMFSDFDMDKADDWVENLREDVHQLLDRYRTDSFTSKTSRPVKIAILDTGVARLPAHAPALMKGPHIKLGKQLDSSLPWNEDVDGHGTHAAGLIRQICPYADVYVYRVLESHESLSAKPLSRRYVAEALRDAVEKKKVDVISMSLGWREDNDRELQDAIDNAKRNKVLLFAASSNDGVRGGMAYPARADEVIAIDAADGHGRSSRFNPPRDTDKIRFTVLGEAVGSSYPKNLESEKPGWKRMSGTSCATPIAAAIAGLVLEFSRQRPLCYDPLIEAHLKTVVGMRQVFKQLLSKQVEGFHHLDPMLLFKCTEEFEDGGYWSKLMAPRMNAAHDISRCLQFQFSYKLGKKMIAAIEKENSKGAQV